jgi:uncharacterized protein (DUF427 family)
MDLLARRREPVFRDWWIPTSPAPTVCQRRDCRMRAIWNGTVVAESQDVVVVDGYTYFPRHDVSWDVLVPSDHTSVCGWKGQARYFTIRMANAINRDAAWEYPDPKPAAAAVRDRIGFWRGVRIEP